MLRRMNLLLFSNEKSKLAIIKEILSLDIRLFYIDFDLLLTGYIKSDVIKPRANIDLYIPEDVKELASSIASISSKINDDIIIIDSFDTMNMLYNDHLLSIYLSVLLANAERSKIIVFSRNKRWFIEHISDLIIDIDNSEIIKD